MTKKKGSESIKVVVRIRPLNSKESQDGHKATTVAHEDRGTIEVCNPTADKSEPAKSFTFDAVFSPKSTQRNIYDVCAAPVVQSVLEGYNGTVFAYGQTGAGKTHTMEGLADPPELRGIIPNSFQHIFDHVALKSSNEKYLVRASYFEIYNEEIRDLLSKTPKGLELKESVDKGVYVKGLISTVVKSISEIDHVMQVGNGSRSVASTQMNQGSSRSHAVFTIVVECCSVDDRGEEHIRAGKLNLVDLAGSERQSKTGATGERLKEGTKINLSLSALGNVISALVDGKSQHVPYRDSKLTRILQDSLGGNTKTVMCANAGPAGYNYDETLSTLRYANRAKNIKNKPVINEDPKDAMLREYQDEIAKLRERLSQMRTVPVEESVAGTAIAEEKAEEKDFNNVNEEKLQELQERADKEKAEIEARSKAEMKIILNEKHQTAEERKALQERLEKESKVREEMEEQRTALKKQLQTMEAKLIIGGEMVSKASKQEAALRKAEQDLIAKREQELSLSRQMTEQEEANLALEEKYSSLAEEVQSKTKKLKKIWTKFQQAKTEIRDLQGEFQGERDDMLETIRHLTKQMKLKELIISNFIPPEYARIIDDSDNGGRAVWDEDDEAWFVPKLEFAGNNIQKRKVSTPGLPRPESEYAKCRKKADNNPRYRYENIISLDLDIPERSTQRYEGPNTVSKISDMLSMSLDDKVEELIFDDDLVPGNPYLKYSKDSNKTSKQGKRPKSSHHKKKNMDRPMTAYY